MKKRRTLILVVALPGAIGVMSLVVPLAGSLKPTARVYNDRQRIVEVEKMEPGQVLVADWGGYTVFIVRRSNEQIANLKGLPVPILRDRTYKENEEAVTDKVFRSKGQEYYVASAWKLGNRFALLGYGNDRYYCENFIYFNESAEVDELLVFQRGFKCSDEWVAHWNDSKAFVYDAAGRSHQPYISHLTVPPYFFRDRKLVLGYRDES